MLNLRIQRDDCMSKGNKNRISKIYLHSHNHHNTIHNSQDRETTQGPTNAWMDKEVMIYVLLLLLSVTCVWLSVTPMDRSTPGFPVLHHLPKFAQTHIHWVGYAIQPSRPQSSPSTAFNLSQHQVCIYIQRNIIQPHKAMTYWHAITCINLESIMLSKRRQT